MKLNKKLIIVGLLGLLILSGCGVDKEETSQKLGSRFKRIVSEDAIDYLVDKKNGNMYIMYSNGRTMNGISPFLDDKGNIIKYSDFEKGNK